MAITASAVLLVTWVVIRYPSSPPPAITAARKKVIALKVAAAFRMMRKGVMSRNLSTSKIDLRLTILVCLQN